MKILHTSDWHLGHTLYNFDRTEEQLSMLRQMRDIVSTEHPDLFLLSGDVYHTSQPSAAVQTMFSDALMDIHEAYPPMVIAVTAGNHDSGMRHEIFRTPWSRLNVHMIGALDRDNPDSHIVEVPGRGYVVAVPYAAERFMPDGFYQSLLDRVGEINKENLPVVMSAHTTVRGCDFSGHDSVTDYTVGGIDYADLADFGSGYDYLALGHIHRPQWVHGGCHKVRYSGTPLAVSFDEAYEHSVSIVTVNRGEAPAVRTIVVENPRPLVTLPSDGAADWDDVKALLRDFPADIPAYVRLNVRVTDFLPADAMAQAVRECDEKSCRICHINTVREKTVTGEKAVMSVSDFKECLPIEIARRYASDIGMEFGDEMTAMFNEVLAAVNEDERNC